MCQVARGVGEIRFQFQCSPVGRDRLRYVPGVLVNWRQVTVGIGERRVDLNGTGVALHCRLDILGTWHSTCCLATHHRRLNLIVVMVMSTNCSWAMAATSWLSAANVRHVNTALGRVVCEDVCSRTPKYTHPRVSMTQMLATRIDLALREWVSTKIQRTQPNIRIYC